jgi:6-methylsalicylate decarboxylase
MTARIDVHNHMVPADYLNWLHEQGVTDAAGWHLPEWNTALAIDTMDQRGIATGILSLSVPGTHLGDAVGATTWAQRVNETAAECVKDHPDRFGFFATLTLPDVDGAVAAAQYAFDELSADGVVLLANSRGCYLGSSGFDPLMAELDRRAAVVFVHPNQLPGPAAAGIPPVEADFLLDTTRAAINLVRNDIPGRYPAIRFVLAHAGGFVPYAAHRLALGISATTGREPTTVLAAFRSFYFDTALSSTADTLACLLGFAAPDHVLYGSDWPFAPDSAVSYFAAELDSAQALTSQQRHDIDRGNALQLFPRLG